VPIAPLYGDTDGGNGRKKQQKLYKPINTADLDLTTDVMDASCS